MAARDGYPAKRLNIFNILLFRRVGNPIRSREYFTGPVNGIHNRRNKNADRESLKTKKPSRTGRIRQFG